MPRLFISYRRQDARWPARSLSDLLKAQFGADNVFMDIDTLQPGEDFVEAIENAVGTCDALIALIGPAWIGITDSAGRRRLENPHDFIRLEIATALSRKIRVVPVLVDGAVMPDADQLPPDLVGLVRRHALDLSEKRFHHDAQTLIATLQKVLGQPAPVAPVEKPPPAPTLTGVLPCDLSLVMAGGPPALLLRRLAPLPATANITLPAPCEYDLVANFPDRGSTSLGKFRVGTSPPATKPAARPAQRMIGIDLGTTNSVVSIMEHGTIKVIPNEEGTSLTPSVVAFCPDGRVLVGQAARRQAIVNPRQTIFSIKRFTGCRGSEIEDEQRKLQPFSIVGGPSEFVQVEVGGERMLPQQISAHVLAVLKKQAENYLGEAVSRAVITVPAYFNDSQRQATMDAARIAGFETDWEYKDPGSGKTRRQHLRIINEPTAAALAYGLQKKLTGRIAVYDLGGGTFDISILDLSDGDGVYQVLATNGNTQLGGDDFDNHLVDYLADEFKKEHGIDLRKNPLTLTRLREAAEHAKRQLSTELTTEVNLPFIASEEKGPIHLQRSISRNHLEKSIDHLLEQTIKCCQLALQSAKVKPADIDHVLLVGGSTRVPAVREAVRRLFGREPRADLNPEEVVSMGAAVQAFGLLQGSKSDLLLLDVTPMSLGIETLGGVCTVLVPGNTTIPTKKSEVFQTATDNQPSVRIHVLQGERPMAADNRTLGKFHLEGIAPAPAGTQKIEVTFEIDANGILLVSAKNVATGQEQSIRVNARAGLAEKELDRLQRNVREAHYSLPTGGTLDAQTLVDLRLQVDLQGKLTVTALDRSSGQTEQLAMLDLR